MGVQDALPHWPTVNGHFRRFIGVGRTAGEGKTTRSKTRPLSLARYCNDGFRSEQTLGFGWTDRLTYVLSMAEYLIPSQIAY